MGSYVVALGYYRVLHNYKEAKKENGQWSSPTPIVGSIMFLLGYLLLPFEHSPWILLIILVDIETAFFLLLLTFATIKYLFYDFWKNIFTYTK